MKTYWLELYWGGTGKSQWRGRDIMKMIINIVRLEIKNTVSFWTKPLE